MRTKLLLLALLLTGGSYLSAEKINVTPGDYVSKYNAANDGDVLLLSDGDYTTDFKFPSGKTITLKAAEGASPLLRCIRIQSEANPENGGLIFDGVNIDLEKNDGKPYFIDITAKDITEITFRNLTFRKAKRGIINTNKVDGTNAINKIIFDNCIIEDPAFEYNFIWTQHDVKEVTVKNSTLYNYVSESFLCPRTTNTSNILNFTFENNTIYKWGGKGGGRALAKIGGMYSSESTYTFRNNIITEPGVSGSMPVVIVDISEGIVTGENNLIVNYGGYVGGTQTINDLTLEGLGLETIGFLDPASGNFTILADSPIATAGTTGGPIGDPRWIATITTPTTIATNSNNANGGTTSPSYLIVQENSTVTAIATPNFGYRFVEWLYADGNTASTQSSYAFNLTEDTQLTAIFEPTTTFITGWNFAGKTEKNDFIGDFYAEDANKGILSLYDVNGSDKIGGTAPSDNTLNGVTYTAFRKWGYLDGTSRHFIAEFSVNGYSNITVSSYLGSRSGYTNFYKTQVMQYSTDMVTYHELVRMDIDNNQWYKLSATLPTLPVGTENVYIRWTADPTNGLVSGEQTAGGESELMIANVVISADKVSESSYTRDCYVDGAFETICLPFEVTNITNGFGNTITPVLYEYNTHLAGSDEVGFKSANSIQAHTPYLIAFPEDDSIEKLPFTFTGTTAGAKTPAKEAGAYIFTGTYDKFSSEDTYYVLNSTGDGFVKAVSSTFVGAYHAYLALANGGGAGARQLSVVFDDGGATDMEEIAQSIDEPNTEISNVYTIDGRLVRQIQPNTGKNPTEGLAKGIYIVNNKKVVVQ